MSLKKLLQLWISYAGINNLYQIIALFRTNHEKTIRILGDINAVKRGTVKKRIANRVIGKVSGRLTGKASKSSHKLFK